MEVYDYLDRVMDDDDYERRFLAGLHRVKLERAKRPAPGVSNEQFERELSAWELMENSLPRGW